jgi:polysaccharide biosynthesis protein PslH
MDMTELSMKVALITPVVVERPSSGFTLRLYQMQRVLDGCAHGQCTAWDLAKAAPQSVLPAFGSTAHGPPSAPKRDAPAASWLRALRDIAALLLLHISPTFAVRSIHRQRDSILEWLQASAVTHVVLAHPYATELVPDLKARGYRTFVDCQNVESDLSRQMLGLQRGFQGTLAAKVRLRTIERWEQQLFPLADEIWVPSVVDAALQQVISRGRARIRCIPNALDLARYELSVVGRNNDVVLPAFFGYEPNVEVDDTLPYLREAGVVAVPIMHGSGTRYKILEALAMGAPVVTTALGCQGLEVQDGTHLLVRQIDQFGEAILSLLKDREYAARLGRTGRDLVERRYGFSPIQSAVCATLFGARP